MLIPDSESGKERVSVHEASVTILVNRWISAFNAHDVKGITELYSEDAELWDTGMKRARYGRAEITTWFAERFQKMPEIRYTPTRFFFHESEAVVCWLTRGKTPPLLHQRWLSRSFEVDGTSVFELRAGSIAWQHGYYDHLRVAENVLPPLRWLPLRL